MDSLMYDEITTEKLIKDRFGVDIDIMQPIVRDVPVGHMVRATLFLNQKKQLYLLVQGESKLTLGDIKKIVAKMHLKADVFLPPKNNPNYFDDIGRSKFKEVFPGRSNITASDILYYRTLALYNPALVLISEVIGNEVYQFDNDSRDKWRPTAKFTYRRIRTS